MPVDLTPTDPSLLPLATSNITGLFQVIIQGLLITAVILFFFQLIWGSYKWILSHGNTDRLSNASKTISNALIGLIISFSAFGVINLVSHFTSLNLFCIEIPGIGFTLGSCNDESHPIPGFPTPTLQPTNTPIGGLPPGVPTATPQASDYCLCSGSTSDCSTYSTQSQCLSNPQCNCQYLPPPPVGQCYSSVNCTNTFSNCSPADSAGNLVDTDHDNYPAQLVPGTLGICQPLPTDCNDTNANVHPRQTTYFTSPIAGSLDNFDYDCSGSNDKHPSYNCLNTLSSTPVCSTTPLTSSSAPGHPGWTDRIPSCGESWRNFDSSLTFTTCVSYQNNLSCGSGSTSRSIGCYPEVYCVTGSNYTSFNIAPNTILPWYSMSGFDSMPCH